MSPRRGAGVVERDGLENRCTGNRTVGSNPTLSAIVLMVMGMVPRATGTAASTTAVSKLWSATFRKATASALENGMCSARAAPITGRRFFAPIATRRCGHDGRIGAAAERSRECGTTQYIVGQKPASFTVGGQIEALEKLSRIKGRIQYRGS